MEVEAKLEAPRRAVLTALARRRRLGPYELRPRAPRRLETIYYDTATRDLAKTGTALRVRRRAGGGVELTIKLAGTVAGGVHRRAEHTWRLRETPGMPFRPRRREVRALLGANADAELIPLVGTRIRRRPLAVYAPGKRAPLAEIDLDDVEFFAPQNRPRRDRGGFYEIEIELTGGDDRDLTRLVRALRELYALKRSRASKLERALRWSRARASRR